MATDLLDSALLSRVGQHLLTEARKHRAEMELGEALVEAGALFKQVEEAHKQLASLQEQITRQDEKAKNDAKAIVEQARAEAAAITANARAAGDKESRAQRDRILEDAQAQADKIVSEAKEKSEEVRSAAAQALAGINASIEEKTAVALRLEARVAQAESRLAELRRATEAA